MKTKIELLQDKVKQAHTGGGAARIESQHKKGKLTARERIHFLMDENSFEEIGMMVTHRSTDFGMEKEIYLGDGVVTGYGNINGRLVYVFHRISLFLVDHFQKLMPKRSVRLWTWP